MKEQELQKIGEWLRSMGYVLNLEDDFWMEDWIGYEHKIREICELLHAYASTKVQEALIKHAFDRENEEDDKIDLSEPDKVNYPPMQGWTCPVCGRGNSPYSMHCGCPPPMIVRTSSSTQLNEGGKE